MLDLRKELKGFFDIHSEMLGFRDTDVHIIKMKILNKI